MNQVPASPERMGLWGAVSVGVGAIVGGGILALAGVAFATTGPSAILAFALNGGIALLTALSFAELSSAFAESGGTYTFAKKVLSVEAAFAVGWVVWFASIVAAALYALGFGAFATIALIPLGNLVIGGVPGWLASPWTRTVLALSATAIYGTVLSHHVAGSGKWINIGKILVFGILVAAGVGTLSTESQAAVAASLSPFFAAGAIGLVQAMGFTFIALQGFDLIAAVAGEVRDARRNVPRAMLISLGISLAIYLPLLLVVATVGSPDEPIREASQRAPESIVARAAESYLGRIGYWLVVIAGLLSMLSALEANLYAASRVALAMARDRTLPQVLSAVRPQRGIPLAAVVATSVIAAIVILALPDVAAAGAASSLIFLVTFALAHGIAILARRRARPLSRSFRAPLFPLVPGLGMAACIGLAVFQGFAVQSAGLIASAWLGLGSVLFLVLFSHRARIVDAASEALDPEVLRMRGRSPLVLVPVANPANAASLVEVANALAPRDVGRVLLLSVAVMPREDESQQELAALPNVQAVLGEALAASVRAGLFPEALTTIAAQPWREISRVARTHRCESLLLGLSELKQETPGFPLDDLVGDIECDVVVLRSGKGFRLDEVKRILVPIGGRGGHDRLRARLLGSLFRTGSREVTFLRVLPDGSSPRRLAAAQRELTRLARDEAPGDSNVEVCRATDAASTVAQRAAQSDLIVLGLQQIGRRRKVFGKFTLRVARETRCPIIMISHRGG